MTLEQAEEHLILLNTTIADIDNTKKFVTAAFTKYAFFLIPADYSTKYEELPDTEKQNIASISRDADELSKKQNRSFNIVFNELINK